MTSITNKLLRDLFKSSEGLYIYTLYQRFNVSPKELFSSINELIEKKLITENEGRLNLTTNGKEFVIKKDITVNSTGNKYDKIPLEFLSRKIKVNEFYLPISQNILSDLNKLIE